MNTRTLRYIMYYCLSNKEKSRR